GSSAAARWVSFRAASTSAILWERWALASSRSGCSKPRSAKTLPLLGSTRISASEGSGTARRRMVRLRGAQPLADHLNLLFRRRDAALGLLLERVEDVHRVLEAHRVHRAVGVAVVVVG